MKKNTMKNNITNIQKVSSKIPKSINEAINFNDDMYEDDEEMIGGEEESPINEPEHEESESGMDVMEFVDDIRKKSLRGMAQLADNPDDERYQLLKKIWQICDKKPEQQTAFGSHNQQPMQNAPTNNGQMR